MTAPAREPQPRWHHSNTMRALVCLCLATGLLAGEAPQPGRDPAFLSRILADTEGGSRPWKTFRAPMESGSAVVEVVGEFTREELRQVVVLPRLLDKFECYSGCGFGVEERLMGRSVIERLMRALVVVVVDVMGDLGAGLLNVLKPVEPGALLFE